MPNINDRIGSQNVIRVLSNAAAPPTRLLNLSDVNSSLRTVDGMILVWDLPTEQFIMTSVIDSSSTTIKGIAYFDNTTNSTLPTNGALIVSGGVGIGENLNVSGDIVISGIATFSSNLDINAAVDILNGLVVNDNFKSAGITTLAANGGITTTGGDLYVGGDLYIADDLVLDEINARDARLSGNLRVVGVTTLAANGGITTTGGDLYVGSDLFVKDNFKVEGTSEFIGNATFRGGTIGIGDTTSDDIDVEGEFISNLVPNTDDTYSLGITTQRWKDGLFSGLVTSTNLFTSGITTLAANGGITTTGGDLYIGGDLYVLDDIFFDEFNARNANVTGIGTIETLDTTTGTIDFLSGTDILYSGIGTIETLDTTTGTIDSLNNTYLNTSGIGTIETLDTTTGTIDSLSNTYLNTSGIATISTLGVTGLTTTKNLLVTSTSTFQDNVSVTGFVTVTEGIYYDLGDYDGPNGVAYFDNSGKLVGAASTENAVTTNYFILTTDAVGIPTWTSVIDGGEF